MIRANGAELNTTAGWAVEAIQQGGVERQAPVTVFALVVMVMAVRSQALTMLCGVTSGGKGKG